MFSKPLSQVWNFGKLSSRNSLETLSLEETWNPIWNGFFQCCVSRMFPQC